jgi:hypothetical protein
MKDIIAIIVLSVLLATTGCKESSTENNEDNTPILVLTADKTTGPSPLTVVFTIYFLGNIDTVQMLVPDGFLFPGTGRTIITYALVDTIQPARQIYSTEYTYNIGTYKAVMLLQSKHKKYYSDTLIISVN